MEWRAGTSRGLVRQDNEDSWAVERLTSSDGESLWVGMVADGLGGHESGEVASSLAVKYAMEYLRENVGKRTFAFEESFGEGGRDILDILKKAVAYANSQVISAAAEGKGSRGMGTTLTVVMVHEGSARLFVGHVGDSRVYLVSKGSIRQITEDHSVTGELVRQGTITEEDAMRHPARNVLTNALGTAENIQVSTYSEDLSPDDIILLSTDGLTSLVSAKEILNLVTGSSGCTVENQLIDLANSRGGYDNATVIIMWPRVPGEGGGKIEPERYARQNHS